MPRDITIRVNSNCTRGDVRQFHQMLYLMFSVNNTWVPPLHPPRPGEPPPDPSKPYRTNHTGTSTSNPTADAREVANATRRGFQAAGYTTTAPVSANNGAIWEFRVTLPDDVHRLDFGILNTEDPNDTWQMSIEIIIPSGPTPLALVYIPPEELFKAGGGLNPRELKKPESWNRPIPGFTEKPMDLPPKKRGNEASSPLPPVEVGKARGKARTPKLPALPEEPAPPDEDEEAKKRRGRRNARRKKRSGLGTGKGGTVTGRSGKWDLDLIVFAGAWPGDGLGTELGATPATSHSTEEFGYVGLPSTVEGADPLPDGGPEELGGLPPSAPAPVGEGPEPVPGRPEPGRPVPPVGEAPPPPPQPDSGPGGVGGSPDGGDEFPGGVLPGPEFPPGFETESAVAGLPPRSDRGGGPDGGPGDGDGPDPDGGPAPEPGAPPSDEPGDGGGGGGGNLLWEELVLIPPEVHSWLPKQPKAESEEEAGAEDTAEAE